MSRPEQTTLTGHTVPVAKVNLHESLPDLNPRTRIARDELRRRLNRLCDGILPLLAGREHYPITADHCFRRVAYDVALGAEWDTKIERPFVDNASWFQLARAVRVAAWMVREGRPAVVCCNDESLRLRGIAR